MEKRLFTSESVTEGHPDKVCDQISDAVLDEALVRDPNSRVACECCCTTGMVMVMGEITTKAKLDVPKIVRNVLKEIGYTGGESGFDADSCAVLVSLDEQSPDIAMGTNQERGGAGDQGIMFGYACNETEDLMPLPITLANQMAYKMTHARKANYIPYILPDGKTQVTVEYGADGMPSRIDTIVISTQHSASCKMEKLREDLVKFVISPVLCHLKTFNPEIDVTSYKLFVNPTGRFVKGGPAADSGLTGRKIIVDTYGGYASHGGGAFSGKDPSKVDRSGAYMARYIAKNIVAAGIASKCQIQLAYAIGVAEPVSVLIDTFGTGTYPDDEICTVVRKLFDLTPNGIARELNLRTTTYHNTAAYGHFGTVTGRLRSWECVNRADEIRVAMQRMPRE